MVLKIIYSYIVISIIVQFVVFETINALLKSTLDEYIQKMVLVAPQYWGRKDIAFIKWVILFFFCLVSVALAPFKLIKNLIILYNYFFNKNK